MRKAVPNYFYMDKATFESVASRLSGRHAKRTMEILYRVIVNRESIESVSGALGAQVIFARHSVESFCRNARAIWPGLMISDRRNMLVTLEIPADQLRHFEDLAEAARLAANQSSEDDATSVD